MQAEMPWFVVRMEVKAVQSHISIVGLTNGLLMAYFSSFRDGLHRSPDIFCVLDYSQFQINLSENN